MVVVFSSVLPMCLPHADGVPITDPGTLKPSNFVCTFEYLYGSLPAVFLNYELSLGSVHIVAKSLVVHIQVVQCCAETLKIHSSASVISVPFLGDNRFFQELDQWDYPYSVNSHCEGITLRCAFGRCKNRVIGI